MSCTNSHLIQDNVQFHRIGCVKHPATVASELCTQAKAKLSLPVFCVVGLSMCARLEVESGRYIGKASPAGPLFGFISKPSSYSGCCLFIFDFPPRSLCTILLTCPKLSFFLVQTRVDVWLVQRRLCPNLPCLCSCIPRWPFPFDRLRHLSERPPYKA